MIRLLKKMGGLVDPIKLALADILLGILSFSFQVMFELYSSFIRLKYSKRFTRNFIRLPFCQLITSLQSPIMTKQQQVSGQVKTLMRHSLKNYKLLKQFIKKVSYLLRPVLWFCGHLKLTLIIKCKFFA